MKVIDIPFAGHRLFFYEGNEERQQFDKHVQKKYPEWNGDDHADGLHFENFIFIEDVKDKGVLIHEAAHYLEWLFLELTCTTESEFKAYLTSHVLMELLNE